MHMLPILRSTHRAAGLLLAVCASTIALAFLALPQSVSAVGMQADAMCNPVKMECMCGFFMDPQKGTCTIPGNKFMCPCKDVTSGHVTMGKCVGPNKCQGETGDGKGLDSGLSKLGEMLGQLLSKLAGGKEKGGGGEGGQPPQQNPFGRQGQQCQQYYPTSDQSKTATDPCAYYVPNVSDVIGGTGTSTGSCSLLDRVLGTCSEGGETPGEGGGGGSGSVATNATIAASDTSGPPPLTVKFTITDTSTSCNRAGMNLDFGDGSTQAIVFQPTTSCGTQPTQTISHTYSTPGTYKAAVVNATTQGTITSVGITVVAPGATSTDTTSGTISAQPAAGNAPLAVVFTVKDTSPSCSRSAMEIDFGDGTNPISVFAASNACAQDTTKTGRHTYALPKTYQASLINKSTGKVLNSISIIVQPNPLQSGQVNLTPGIRGDILMKGGSATLVAGTRDTTKNTETAGFYGSEAPTGQASTLVSRMCLSRPWASNFLTFIVPPSFFDTLCAWRGFDTGAGAGATGQWGKKPAPRATTTAPAPPPIPPRVEIWAAPKSVPIGGRTSVFWNTRGVANCTITSPDGGFSHNTLSGGASTLPITGKTTFTISCLTPDSKPVTDYVVVEIAI